MNTNGLAKHYEHLTPRERLPLIYAARERGDDAERERLVRSTPRITFSVANCYGMVAGLNFLALYHSVRMLDLATLYWRIECMLADVGNCKEKAGKNGAEMRLFGDLKLCAYLITVHADAWKQFCTELGIDADEELRDLPCYETLQQSEEMARKLAFAREHAIAFLRRETGRETGEVISVEVRCKDLRDALEFYIGNWS